MAVLNNILVAVGLYAVVVWSKYTHSRCLCKEHNLTTECLQTPICGSSHKTMEREINIHQRKNKHTLMRIPHVR